MGMEQLTAPRYQPVIAQWQAWWRDICRRELWFPEEIFAQELEYPLPEDDPRADKDRMNEWGYFYYGKVQVCKPSIPE